MVGNIILEQAATEGHRFTRLEEAYIFHQERHTAKRPLGEPMRYRPARLLILLVYDRIDGRIDLFCPRDGSLQNFLGANLTLDNECGEAGGVIFAIIGKFHS